MFVHLPEAELAIDQLIAEGKYNDALAHLVVGVHNTYKTPEWEHKYLYYPGFDRQIRQLAQVLPDDAGGEFASRRNTLVLASELYQLGGHSKVVEDIVREVESPVLVLTDIFFTYGQMPERLHWILEVYEDAPLIVLQQRTLWGKCKALNALVRRLQPRNILYFQHHQDPIPFVATAGQSQARRTLVHHCDHNPSLGNTLEGFHHVDFSAEMSRNCSSALGLETDVLPLYVPDGGRKAFQPIERRRFSVITSGTHVKFQRTGELALQTIVEVALRTAARFYHVGPIDENWVAEIRNHLQRLGIDAGRFVAVGAVTSLWGALLSLDAHLYLGSAPVGGGRAAIEAQGCGYPVAFFRAEDRGSAIGADSIYANKDLGWTTLSELSALLESFPDRQPRLSDAARKLYDESFSRDEFVRSLKRMVR